MARPPWDSIVRRISDSSARERERKASSPHYSVRGEESTISTNRIVAVPLVRRTDWAPESTRRTAQAYPAAGLGPMPSRKSGDLNL
jgi:hypothetical protein